MIFLELQLNVQKKIIKAEINEEKHKAIFDDALKELK